VSLDLIDDQPADGQLRSVKGDLRDASALDRLLSVEHFDAIVHCAAILAHGGSDPRYLWDCNVGGTRNLAAAAAKHGVRRVVFTSSNCLWTGPMGRPVTEDDVPNPREVYGQSKWEGEKILLEHRADFEAVILRCPTIIDSGRLGLLAILFEFIQEGRRVWVVGGGQNRYQFVAGRDLARACELGLTAGAGGVFNVGSDNVPRLRDVYQYVVDRAATGARVAAMPRRLTLLAMRVAHGLHLSPLGPYHYRMIAEDFVFDTSRIKARLGWNPTLENGEMLWVAYQDYLETRALDVDPSTLSAHRQPARMGLIKILKAIS
jgi:nucleoside-diphosphate-sugar epimerase